MLRVERHDVAIVKGRVIVAEGGLWEVVLAGLFISKAFPVGLHLPAKETSLVLGVAAAYVHESVVYGVEIDSATRLTEGSLEETLLFA